MPFLVCGKCATQVRSPVSTVCGTPSTIISVMAKKYSESAILENTTEWRVSARTPVMSACAPSCELSESAPRGTTLAGSAEGIEPSASTTCLWHECVDFHIERVERAQALRRALACRCLGPEQIASGLKKGTQRYPNPDHDFGYDQEWPSHRVPRAALPFQSCSRLSSICRRYVSACHKNPRLAQCSTCRTCVAVLKKGPHISTLTRV